MFNKKKFRDTIGQLTSGCVLRYGSINQTSEETDELFDRVEYNGYIIYYNFADSNNPTVTIKDKNKDTGDDIVLNDSLSNINPNIAQDNQFLYDLLNAIKIAYDCAK